MTHAALNDTGLYNISMDDAVDGVRVTVQYKEEDLYMSFLCTDGRIVVTRLVLDVLAGGNNPFTLQYSSTDVYYTYDWLLGIVNRWKKWARDKKRARAANIIRNFYFDWIQPKVYDPRKEGKGFLKLLEQFDSNINK
jgi:hypothetical protein